MLAERFVPPLNADEVCGYRRPNCHFVLDAQKPSDLVKHIDNLIKDEFGECFEISQSALTYQLKYKKKGHIYQYVRAIVLSHYKHEISSEEAMKDWTDRTSLTIATPSSSKNKKKTTPSDVRTKQIWTADELAIVRSTLQRIHDYQGKN